MIMKKHFNMIYSFILILLIITLFCPVFFAAEDNPDCDAGNHEDIIIEYIAPTETTNGKIKYQCAICGRTYTDRLFATGHVWSDWIIETEPTLDSPGLRYRVCTQGGSHREWEEIPSPAADPYDRPEPVVLPSITESEFYEEPQVQNPAENSNILIFVNITAGAASAVFLWSASAVCFTGSKILRFERRRIKQTLRRQANRSRLEGIFDDRY